MSDTDDALGPATVELVEPDTDVFGAIDPDEAPGGHRRRGVLVLAVVLLVGLAAGLLVWQPWSSDDAAAPVATDGEAAVPAELIIDVEGVDLVRSTRSFDDFGSNERAQQGFVFAAPGADLERGPYLVFLVQELAGNDGVEPPNDDPGADTVEINGHTATVEDNDVNLELYWEGEPGVRYGVAAAGVSRDRAIEFARAVTFEGGVTTVTDDDVIAGMEPAGDVATLFAIISIAQPLFSTDPEAIAQEYTTEQGDTITLATAEVTGEFTGLASLIIDDERIVEVDGHQVLLGTLAADIGMDEDGLRVALTVRGGRLIGITSSGVDDDGLLALLAAVRPATDDEWAAVLAVVENPMDDFLGSDEGGGTLPADTEP